MDKFQVIQPSTLLAPYVRQYWFLTMENVSQGAQRLIPSGCVSLTFQREWQDALINGGLPISCLSGQSTAYTNLTYSGTIDFISVVFQPAGAMAFFKIPLKELKNENIPIDMLGDLQLSELENRLMDCRNNESCVRLIEAFLLRRMYDVVGNDRYKRMKTVMESIHYGQGNISLLAQTACLGYKQFKRIFTEHIGMNPKDYLRISRFQGASYMMQIQPELTLTGLAEACGYYDTSHLIKEFKEFSGYTPGEFLSVCNPYSDYHSQFRSTFLDVKF